MTEDAETASAAIDARIASLPEWQGAVLSRIRALIHDAVPEVVEEVKWRGVPVWSADGILCTGETYRTVVKLTFMNGAALEDPKGIFNSSLEGNTRRAIDIGEGSTLDEEGLKDLFAAAAAFNRSKKASAKARKNRSQ